MRRVFAVFFGVAVVWGAVVVGAGCLTAPGRAIRSGINTVLSMKLEQYCAARTEPERRILRESINSRLRFSGEIVIQCQEPPRFVPAGWR